MRLRRAVAIWLLWTPLAGWSQISPKMKMEEIYRQYCASCHGANFEGGNGGNLADGVWKHGSADEEIGRSIAVGKPEIGMVPFGNVLSDEQIRAMVIFLREAESKYRSRTVEYPRPEPDKVTRTQHQNYRMEMVAEGLEIPWALAFLPDGRMLVTERPGGLKIIGKDGTQTKIEGTPPVIAVGQGGMLEVAPHPDYAKNGWVYLAFSDGWWEGGRQKSLTAVVRGRIKDNKWTDQQVVSKADPKFYTGAAHHYGTRIVFDKGCIFFIVAERGGNMEAQDLTRPNGKVFRLHDDGRVPDDNPFVKTPGAIAGIWSYGHRNPQGMTLDTRTRALYLTEHGPRGGDEFNRVLPGHNYGWPVITHGMNYNGTPLTKLTAQEGMDQPLTQWTPSIAACGLAFYDGKALPGWKDDFFAGGLASQELHRLRLDGDKVTEDEIVLKGVGRVRDVRTGPDGFLYVVTNEPDRIIRLVPAD